ncbi:chymotrypsinogen 1-like [Tropilaelaps mercedesae]|uniref:Chymotrypsinogen 1-like n=1 Tax=Tropilaelaps mercedesae TaxID=418985 RepID=A0A1V9WZ44_9ACAR|nr:chymotrypsinogen 1-like [Tropilaelaps mercedesae]
MHVARIVNGSVAATMFPWTVMVIKTSYGEVQSFGTGALVTPLHVITAAHLLQMPGEKVAIKYGSNVVEKMKIAPAVGVRTISNRFRIEEDIALLLLETPLSSVRRLCVPPLDSGDPDKIPPEGKPIVIAGFGAIEESAPGEGGFTPRQLMYTNEIVLPDNHCDDYEGVLISKTFCAKARGTGICRTMVQN